jgi:hypothetical protein
VVSTTKILHYKIAAETGVINSGGVMYKISQKIINKRKRGPLIVLLYVFGLSVLFALSSEETGFDWLKFSLVFGVVGVFSAGSNFLGARRFLVYSDRHTVEITPEGLKSIEFDTYNILPWEKVVSIKQKLKGNKISKLILNTATSGSVDLSRYEKLESLSSELKKYINTSLWQ